DTSGVRRFDYLVEAVKRAGSRKLIFGSDGPWLHPGLELHKIRLLGLPHDQEARILGGNALRLLSTLRRGRAAAVVTQPGRGYVLRKLIDSSTRRELQQQQALPPGTFVEHEL